MKIIAHDTGDPSVGIFGGDITLDLGKTTSASDDIIYDFKKFLLQNDLAICIDSIWVEK